MYCFFNKFFFKVEIFGNLPIFCHAHLVAIQDFVDREILFDRCGKCPIRKKSAAAIKSMKVGTDELKDLIKGAVKEAMGEEDDTGDDGSDAAAALDGITAEDMADIIEQAVDNANEKRKSRKDAGEEVGDLTADEVIQEAAEIIDAMTADEGMWPGIFCRKMPPKTIRPRSRQIWKPLFGT